MSVASSARLHGDTSRSVSIRYFNFYRFVIASLLGIFGAVFQIGEFAPAVYAAVVFIYWLAAVGFMLITPRTRHQLNTLLMWQVALDVIVLTAVMFISGTQRGSVPYLLMTTLAGAALVGEGRMVLGFAAMATISVLAEQAVRIELLGVRADDLTRTGITCLGYFAVALLARLLARRALENEALASQRGAALQRQVRVNSRIIEDMQDGVVVVDVVGLVRQINPRAVELLGVELVEGERIDMRVPELAAGLEASVAGESPLLRIERTGKALRLRRVVASEGGDQVLYLEDLARVEAQAQQLKLAALGRLTANIAHEIRNPLASVTQAAELLQDEKRTQMQQRLSRIVLDNSARIERIVRDVLEVGRRDRATIETLDATAFVRNFVEEFAMHTPLATECVRLDIEGQPKILFDRVHLAQILGNLLGNALRYCRQQSGSVHLVVALQGPEHLLVSISDDGPGIAAEERERIFEPFHTTDPKGTGLGLYVAQELADANGARLFLAETATDKADRATDAAGVTELRGAEFHLIARGLA
ncbi:ATP-binding protein [Uliginosibacterium sp. H3]|uniref:histidine kinase n=1 Tax=Uliginosibacterium silvisoli TaxID=3114758 RepID=A0ABU6K7T6_9RHOO|nr:ATP-binding protein [Uliginosibacterium sp. H3]